MKNFAYIDENNLVVNVSVGEDNWSKQGWIACNNVCGIGYTYDLRLQAFISPKCHDEAVLDETTLQWDCANAEHKKTL